MSAQSLTFPFPPKHTKRYTSISADDLLESEVVIAVKVSTEKRGHLPLWNELSDTNPEKIILIEQVSKEEIAVNEVKIALRDQRSLENVFASSASILLDISGLAHYVWAPLLKAALSCGIATRVLYAEPESYKIQSTPISDSIFDLSVSFDGLAPLPGFACLDGPENQDQCLFVALLGFEGNRPERLMLQLDPKPDIIPVVG